MSIELGSIGSAVGSVASGIGGGIGSAVANIGGGIEGGLGRSASLGGPSLVAPSFEVSSIGGALSGFAKMEGPSMPIINEGPVGLADFQNTAPLHLGQINPVSEVRFESPVRGGPVPESFSVESVIAEAQSILSQARVGTVPEQIPIQETGLAVGNIDRPAGQVEAEAVIEPEIIKEAAYWFVDVEPKIVKPAEVIVPQVESARISTPAGLPLAEAMAARQSVAGGFMTMALEAPVLKTIEYSRSQPQARTENVVSASPAMVPAVAILPQPAQAEQEVVEETTQRIEEKESEREKDEVSVKKRIHLVDQPVLVTVLSETRRAIEKAKEEAEKLGLGRRIIGSIVARFLPAQHEGNTGGAVKPHGIDGTIIARKAAIACKQEFSSEKDVIEVVFENRPVTVGENGDLATQKEVNTTYLGRIVKPSRVIQIVEIRRRKKTIEKITPISTSQEVVLSPKETKLEELNPALAEVFAKVA